MRVYKGELTLSADGRLWFNDDTGRCIIRIQGIPTKKIQNLDWKDEFIDIKLD